MKTYHGTRLSTIPGDVKVSVIQTVGTCAVCQIEVAEGFDKSFNHFNEKYQMCFAPILDREEKEHPLMKRTTREPTDFEWGPHHNLGSTNLALALLWDALGESPSRQLAKSFSLSVLSNLSYGCWNVSESEINDWVNSRSHRHIATVG